MKPNATRPAECCGGPLRYGVSTILVVLLLGLLPAACSDPEGQAVSQGTQRTATYGSDATEEQPRGDEVSEPDGEGGSAQEQTSERPPR